MSNVAFLDEARIYAARLEDREVKRTGVDLPAARAVVSRTSGVRPSVFENLRRGRLKSIAADIHHALRAALISDLERELALAEHELTILRASHRRVDHGQILSCEQSIALLRRTLKENS